MINLRTQRVVGQEHIDAGNHANWRAQLSIAESVHFELRNKHGFDLEQLRTYWLFLVISNVNKIDYINPLKLGDTIDANVLMWISGKCSIEVEIKFFRSGKLVTRFNWTMVMTSDTDARPRRIPEWLMEEIGSEKPICKICSSGADYYGDFVLPIC